MKYRINRKTGDKFSEIGIGTAYMAEAGIEKGAAAVRKAYENGVNVFDLAAGHDKAFTIWGEALSDVRKDVMYQIAFGAEYSTGVYGKANDLDTVKRALDWMLEELKTDYIDYGFIHCKDTVSDWENFKEKGILDYLMKLHDEGTVKHIALSSHTPAIAQMIMDEVSIELLMFSINAAYDYGEGDYAHGGVGERMDLYRRCEAEDIGITVMKTFAGGQLLDASQSPFGKALTRYQCMKYALDKPGVLSLMAGARSEAEVDELLAYYDQPADALDYSIISTFAPPEAEGRCVYCNHCAPCPVGIDIGLVNKYYDLAKAGDDMAADHYMNLEKTAADCTGCGHCDDTCPFRVEQSSRMQEIAEYFSGKR